VVVLSTDLATETGDNDAVRGVWREASSNPSLSRELGLTLRVLFLNQRRFQRIDLRHVTSGKPEYPISFPNPQGHALLRVCVCSFIWSIACTPS
jgi:hypothetical protein